MSLMKLSKFIYMWIAGSLLAFPVLAQTTTVTPTPTKAQTEQDSQIDRIKQTVAETIAGKDEKAAAGFVETINNDSIKLSDEDNAIHTVRIDSDLTTFYSIGRTTTEIQQDDLEEGDYVFVTGPKLEEEIQAIAVYRDTPYSVFTGKITQVDDDEYAIRIITRDKKEYVVDIETDTDQEIMDISTLETGNAGFSKLKEGDSVHVVATKDENIIDRFSAQKVLIIPNEYFIQ